MQSRQGTRMVRGMQKRRVLVLLLAAALIAAAVIGVAVRHDGNNQGSSAETGRDFSARFAQYKAAPEPNGELAKVIWPSYVTDAGPEVKRLYEFQVTHGDLMRYMPCFCGCGNFAHHRSNRDCYVKEVRPDGSVVLDPMAPT